MFPRAMLLNGKSKGKEKGKEMDLRLGSSSSGKRKHNEDRGIDIISNMPDCILQHIFFFLSTKDVFRTSILSRRWRYLWTSLSNLDLEYETSWDINREMLVNNFLEFVNRVLASHDASVIKRLRLRMFDLPEKFSNLNLWISIVVDHNVEELELLLGSEPQCELPDSLFTCRSLISLQINSPLTLKAPPNTCFRNLKKLLLSKIIFADELSTQRLFSNCPVFDELKLVNCDWKNIKNVTICVPSIKNLTIIGDRNENIFGEKIGDQITDSHVQIIAANLAFLVFSCYLDVDFEFIDLSSLKTASLDLPYNDVIEEEVASRALTLFSWISNVEYLTLSTYTIQCLSFIEASLDHLPTIDNLTSLTVVVQFFSNCAVFLLEFLEKMPKLEYLELSEGCPPPTWIEEHTTLRDEIMQQRVPSCFNSSLRTFVVKKCEVVLLERIMIEYVLKNAIVLESLCISCAKDLNKKRLSYFKSRLKKIPRASESCSIEFSF